MAGTIGTSESGLKRALGTWDLTALGINSVIGGAIFLMPAQVAAQVGNWGALAFLLGGLAGLCVALCFAEVGSRFDGTGGAYLYTHTAFGPFWGFLAGWMAWFTRVSSFASIVNGAALALGFYWPGLRDGFGRASVVTAIIAGLAWVNSRGIRQSAWVINMLTLLKLTPLLLFTVIGLFHADWGRLAPLPPITLEQATVAGLLLVFAYGGFETLCVPGGEALNPKRDVPLALVGTMCGVTLIMTLTQVVAMATLPDLPSSRTPLADAAQLFMGPLGAAMIGAGSVVSMVGNNASSILSSSRLLYAFSAQGVLPEWFAKVHPERRTPLPAIWGCAFISLVLALSGSFLLLATVSAVARLVTYAGVILAVPRLRAREKQGRVQPAKFRLPYGMAIPAAAGVLSLGVVAGASWEQVLGGTAALAVGAGIYWTRHLAGGRRG